MSAQSQLAWRIKNVSAFFDMPGKKRSSQQTICATPPPPPPPPKPISWPNTTMIWVKNNLFQLTRINNSLNLLIGSICEVGESPTGVSQHFTVRVVEKCAQCWKALADHLKFWGWVFVAAQIGNSPCNIAHEASLSKQMNRWQLG